MPAVAAALSPSVVLVATLVVGVFAQGQDEAGDFGWPIAGLSTVIRGATTDVSTQASGE